MFLLHGQPALRKTARRAGQAQSVSHKRWMSHSLSFLNMTVRYLCDTLRVMYHAPQTPVGACSARKSVQVVVGMEVMWCGRAPFFQD